MSSTAKKIIILVGSAAVLLAVLLIILFTCGNDNNPEQPKDSDSQSESIGGLPTPEDSDTNTESTTDPADVPTNEPEQSTNEPSQGTDEPADGTTESQDQTTDVTNDATEAPTQSSTEPASKPTEPTTIETFEHKADTVYITVNNVYTRKAAVVADYTEHKVVHYGASFERIAASENWSCINVDGIYCYILNEYIDTEEPPEIVDTPEDTDAPDTPTPGDPNNPDGPTTPVDPSEFVEDHSVYYVHTWSVNVRFTPEVIGSFGDEVNNVAGHLAYGDTVQAIASNDKWVRLSFTKDGTSYVCYVAKTSSANGSVILSKTPPTPIDPSTPEDTTDTPVVTEPSTETEEQPSK